MKRLCRAYIFLCTFFALLWFSFGQPAIHTLAQQPTTQPKPVETKVDPKIFDAYVGQYEDAANLGGTIFSFFREGDKFYGQVPNQDKFEVFPTNENKFLLKITAAQAGV